MNYYDELFHDVAYAQQHPHGDEEEKPPSLEESQIVICIGYASQVHWLTITKEYVSGEEVTWGKDCFHFGNTRSTNVAE